MPTHQLLSMSNSSLINQNETVNPNYGNLNASPNCLPRNPTNGAQTSKECHLVDDGNVAKGKAGADGRKWKYLNI
jgi:hypothetical protein